MDLFDLINLLNLINLLELKVCNFIILGLQGPLGPLEHFRHCGLFKLHETVSLMNLSFPNLSDILKFFNLVDL